MIEDEDEQTDAKDQRSNGHELEVRAYCIFEYSDEGVLSLDILAAGDERNLDVVTHYRNFYEIIIQIFIKI